MRTTITIREDLLAEAQKLSGKFTSDVSLWTIDNDFNDLRQDELRLYQH